jgi:hypothetical protein
MLDFDGSGLFTTTTTTPTPLKLSVHAQFRGDELFYTTTVYGNRE